MQKPVEKLIKVVVKNKALALQNNETSLRSSCFIAYDQIKVSKILKDILSGFITFNNDNTKIAFSSRQGPETLFIVDLFNPEMQKYHQETTLTPDKREF